MKKASQITFCICIVLILNSCRKDTIINSTTTPLSAFKAGDSSVVTVNIINQTLGNGNNKTESVFLDVNKDGQDDFNITFNSYQHAGGTIRDFSGNVVCIHKDALLNVFKHTDSLFLHKSISTYTTSGYFSIDTVYTHDCSRISSNDKCDSVQKDKTDLVYFKKNDELNTNSNFLSTIQPFNHLADIRQSQLVSTKYNLTNDTAYNTVKKYYYCKNAAPQSESFYCCYKLLVSGKERLGWIKLNLKWPYLTVIETAFDD
ncbi:MAG: hypothetical protein IT236_01925 [Bacteroidia bacterium]|nr:hypothetical protein [Bacteroidia bacterium]